MRSQREMVRLEQFSEKHLPLTLEWMKDSDLKKNFLFRKDLTKDSHWNWFCEYESDKSQEIYAIYQDNIHVGNVGLKNIDLSNKNAETWIYIGETSAKGRGIAVLAYKLLFLKYKQQLHKIYANIASFNSSSVRMYQKAGFSQEGNFKDQLRWEEQFCDILRFAFFV